VRLHGLRKEMGPMSLVRLFLNFGHVKGIKCIVLIVILKNVEIKQSQ
jgi:hypothetical protein